MTRFTLIAALACLAWGTASAQTVYRCGSEYTRVPCTEGKLVDVSGSVTAGQRAEAREAALREQRLGDAMARERRAEAAARRPAMAANIGPAKVPAEAPATPKKKSKAKKKPGETVNGDFIARVPKTKAKTKAA